LEHSGIQGNIFGTHGKSVLLEAFLGMGRKQSKDWYTTDTPFFRLLGNLMHRYAVSSQTSLNQATSRKSTGRCQATVEVGWHTAASLVSKEVRDWGKGTVV
jgi:hypothetical protein